MILLARHGQTRWNVERRIQGRTHSDLTPLGLRQARAVAGLLANLAQREDGPWRLVSSPQQRALATAQAVSDALRLPVETDERLAEVCCGGWEGRLREEVGASGPEWFFGAPGGESYEEVRGRVADWLDGQSQEPERRVIVVSHGVAGRLLRGAYAGLSRAETLGQDVPQDAVYRLMAGRIDRFDCEPLDQD